MASDKENSVLHVYERHGAAWAKLRSNDLVEIGWLDRFCSLLPPEARILDIGCGSGVPIARTLVMRGFNVTGVDGSQTMLTIFRRNLPQADAHLVDMRRLSLGLRFSGILAWDSLFHLSPEDQRTIFTRFSDHALPGAALMFTSGPAAGDAIGDLEGASLYHGSLDQGEYRTLLNQAGFAVVSHTIEDPNCGFRTVWLAVHRA